MREEPPSEEQARTSPLPDDELAQYANDLAQTAEAVPDQVPAALRADCTHLYTPLAPYQARADRSVPHPRTREPQLPTPAPKQVGKPLDTPRALWAVTVLLVGLSLVFGSFGLLRALSPAAGVEARTNAWIALLCGALAFLLYRLKGGSRAVASFSAIAVLLAIVALLQPYDRGASSPSQKQPVAVSATKTPVAVVYQPTPPPITQNYPVPSALASSPPYLPVTTPQPHATYPPSGRSSARLAPTNKVWHTPEPLKPGEEIRLPGMFGFPQQLAQVFTHQFKGIRISAVSDNEHLFIQAIHTSASKGLSNARHALDDTAVFAVDWGGGTNRNLSFHLRPGQSVGGTPQVRVYTGPHSESVAVQSSATGNIQYAEESIGSLIRVDSLLVPIKELNVQPGGTVRVVGVTFRRGGGYMGGGLHENVVRIGKIEGRQLAYFPPSRAQAMYGSQERTIGGAGSRRRSASTGN